jgi:hypothetical protein
MRHQWITMTWLGLLTALGPCARGQFSADNADTNINRAVLATRTHETWEGTYKLAEVQMLRIESMTNLYLVLYRCAGHDGTIVDFATARTNGEPRFLREANDNVKGVTPILEGVDVLPTGREADIIVRWMHPGNGGHRTVERYRYTSDSLELIARSHFRGKGFGLRWISDRSTLP